MVKVYPVVGAILSFIALVLLTVGAFSNHWMVLKQSDESLNPTLVNAKTSSVETRTGTVSGLAEIKYVVSHLGLWIACLKEHKSAVSCSFIRTSCSSNVCWIRRTTVASDKVCKDDDIAPINTCLSYNFVRAFMVIATILLIFGTAFQIVSLLHVNRRLAMIAGLMVFIAGLVTMVGFAIFTSNQRVIRSIGHYGFSYKLVVASWPIALCGGLLSCLAASMGLRHKEVSDYSASNY